MGRREQKRTHRPTQLGAADQWRRRSGAMGCSGNGGRRGGGGDGAANRWSGAPDSTHHRRGFGRGGARPNQRGPCRLRRRTNNAGYSPSHLTGAAQAVPVGGPVSARPAPLIRAPPRMERGDETPRSTHEEEDTTYEATEERYPPNSRERLRQAAEEGGKGEGASPTSSTRPRHTAKERVGTLKRHSRGTPRERGH